MEAFGPKTFVIRAVPAIFEKENAVSVLKTFLEEKEDGKLKTGLENQKEEIAALIACKKKSVRAYDPLSAVQLQALLERLAQCENPFSCPHGRPTLIQHTFADLEKQFKRKL
jgi:DNA mismatch repair protein MutL